MLMLSLIGGLIALGMVRKHQPAVVEPADRQVSRLEGYKRHRQELLSELSRPDLKTFAILACNIGVVSMLIKDSKALVPQPFFVATVVFGAVSCLSLFTALWSRQGKTKVKTAADLDAKLWPTIERLQAELFSLEKILRKKHFFFNMALGASSLMSLAAFTGALA